MLEEIEHTFFLRWFHVRWKWSECHWQAARCGTEANFPVFLPSF